MPKLKKDFENFLNICVTGNWDFNLDGSISIEGDLDCSSFLKSSKKLNTGFLPKIKIKSVSGDFNCSNNNLISLQYSPEFVGGSFKCYSNNLKSLEFCSSKIGANLDCMYNQIETLFGCPAEIFGNIVLDFNELNDLQGGPKIVSGDYRVSTNQLISLIGSPIEIGGSFICENNNLESLIGGPKTVGKNYSCSQNYLTDLKGSPDTVGGNFCCSNNSIHSLERSPLKVTGGFDCRNNKLESLKGCSEFVGGGFNASNNSLISLEGLPSVNIEDVIIQSNKISDKSFYIIAKDVVKGIPYKVSLALSWDLLDYTDQENLSHFLDYKEVSEFIIKMYTDDPIGITKIYDRIPVHIRKKVMDQIKKSIEEPKEFNQTLQNVSDLISSGIFDDDI